MRWTLDHSIVETLQGNNNLDFTWHDMVEAGSMIESYYRRPLPAVPPEAMPAYRRNLKTTISIINYVLLFKYRHLENWLLTSQIQVLQEVALASIEVIWIGTC